MSSVPAESGPANLADVVRAAADAAGDRPALVGAHGVRTWAELNAAVDAGAAELSAHQVGERVVLAMPTGADLAAALFAVLRAGLVAVPVDPAHTDLAWVARRVDAVAAVTDEAVAGTEVLGSSRVADWWRDDGVAGPGRSGGEDVAVLARASRRQPPVMLSHRALLGAVAALRGAPRLDLRPDDRVLQVLPLFHVVGLVTAFLPAAVAGAAVVVPGAGGSATRVEHALEAVRAHRVSVLPAEPTLYRQLHRIPGFERALATVRLMTSGSSPLDPADFSAIRAATGQAVREGYGISESAAAVTSTLMTDAARPGSVGLPYPGVQVRIVGDDDPPAEPAGSGQGTEGPTAGGTSGGQGSGGDRASGDEVSGDEGSGSDGASGDEGSGGDGRPGDEESGDDGESGDGTPGDRGSGEGTAGLVVSEDDDELLIENAGEGGDVGPIAIRGVTLFSGYWPDGHGGPAPDGWFRTGDLGYLDDAGELHLVDRVAETVTIAGFTVYPREVEDVLVSHPYVADAAVVGVPGPGGPAVVAALVAHRGTRPTHDDLDEFLADRLPPFKRPTDYQLVDVLPRTEVGRLDRVTVRQNYARYRGISLDQPVRRGPAARARDAGGPVVQAVPGTAPEAAAGLDRLGIKLPAADSRTRRSAQDTDEDLF